MDIQPYNQNLDQAFSSTVYHIDFYQRDYKWTEEPVRRLLDDIFYQFSEAYKKHHELEPTKETINARYPWYYLNTYVTNTIEGCVYVVDGQQRLTTLTLILIKLRHMAESHQSKTSRWLENKIAGFSGTDYEFWMNHARHLHILRTLMDDENNLKEINTNSSISARNMVNNYQVIKTILEERLTDPHQFETFVFYYLLRLVIINLSVEQTDVPMVFEVINDRGVRLKPYEILKGKLLGQIDKLELDKNDYNGLWERQVQAVNSIREDEIDTLFRYWLKAKFANSRKEGQRFDGDYHREMFRQEINDKLRLDHNAVAVKQFLDGSFRYFTKLYVKVAKATRAENSAYPCVFFNSLNELDSQFMLVIAACAVDDSEEDAKIAAVSRELDRLFTLLQLQGAYDSNEFATELHLIAAEIRERPVEEIPAIFNTHLLSLLSKRRAVQVTEPFTYPLFRTMSVDRLNTRFIRYFFGRVDRFLAQGMKVGMKHSLSDLVSKRGHKTGFHVEHILSHNAGNLAMFENDEDRFGQERNRLGGVLLLKGRDNISSSNESFADKLKSYASTLYWNETLRADSYKSKLDFAAFQNQYQLSFRPLEQFGPNELEERHRLLFDLTTLIWGTSIEA